eukprot:6213232-Pleurochrysis_carterae.AAC.2
MNASQERIFELHERTPSVVSDEAVLTHEADTSRLLLCCMRAIQNVFGEFWKRSRKVSHQKEEAYERMVVRVHSWADNLFEEEANVLLHTYPFFEDVMRRVIRRWQYHCSHLASSLLDPMREENMGTRFIKTFLHYACTFSEIRYGEYFATFTFRDRRSICLDIMRCVLSVVTSLHPTNPFVMDVADDIKPSDSISNVNM